MGPAPPTPGLLGCCPPVQETGISNCPGCAVPGAGRPWRHHPAAAPVQWRSLLSGVPQVLRLQGGPLPLQAPPHPRPLLRLSPLPQPHPLLTPQSSAIPAQPALPLHFPSQPPWAVGIPAPRLPGRTHSWCFVLFPHSPGELSVAQRSGLCPKVAQPWGAGGGQPGAGLEARCFPSDTPSPSAFASGLPGWVSSSPMSRPPKKADAQGQDSVKGGASPPGTLLEQRWVRGELGAVAL